MKYLACALVIMFAACKATPKTSEQGSMRPRKAAIAERFLYEIHTLHFDINTPPGHPSKIEEYIIKGWDGQRKDTIRREYIYENDKLVKVMDNEFRNSSAYIFGYDGKGCLTHIDQQTPTGSFHKYKIIYHPNEMFDASREHYMFDKLEDVLNYSYYGNTDSLLISSTEGPEMCYFKEVSDTMFVERTWRDHRNIIMSNKVETYDKNNRLVRIAQMEKGRVDRVINFTYDEHGNQLSRADQDEDNIIGSSVATIINTPDAYRAVYEYDSRGNWTKRTEKNTSGKYNAVSTRKISYVQ